MCCGVQLLIGRISLLNGAMETSSLKLSLRLLPTEKDF